jgi:L-lactate dehydrogenase complex protein LldG
MTDARTELLARVRATSAVAAQPIPRGYRRHGTLTGSERVTLFCTRAAEYRAEVDQVGDDTVAEHVDTVCARLGATRLLVPAAVPPSWRPRTVEVVHDDNLSHRALSACDGTLTGCTVAVAETGTIVLAAQPYEGRRALTLIPDLHICVVRQSEIVELLPEAFAFLAHKGLERSPLTFISGPSATSDIELTRVEGVHGPRNLVIVITG